MSDETDKPESDTDPDDSFLSGEENDGQEFSLDQLSEAYAKVLKEQNRSGSEDPAEDDNGDLSKDGEERLSRPNRRLLNQIKPMRKRSWMTHLVRLVR